MTATLTATPLSAALQQRTARAHEDAENQPFVRDLLEGRADGHAVVALLTQSLPIYTALERHCAAHATDPRLAPIHDTALLRTDALTADLAAHRDAGRVCDTVLPATAAYVAELDALADHPAGLVGHHYVRYLGDLSGGQIIARLVRRHYDLDEGLSFYDFDIAKPKVYKDGYRAALDALPLGGAERADALDAAVRAFELNARLFEELADLTARG